MLELVLSRVRQNRDSVEILVSGIYIKQRLLFEVYSTFSADMETIASSMGDSSGLVKPVILGTASLYLTFNRGTKFK